jgi:nucleotide-binding universal stress UspA family protein
MSEVRFRRITVAIDGSPHGAAALDCAIDLAKHYASQLVILSVAPVVPVYVPSTDPYVPAALPDGEFPRYREFVETAVRQAEAAGIDGVTGLCEEGVVVDEILAHLEQHPSDLLIVGSHGRSAARRILLGSVSTAMVTHAPCPVLVVRQDATPSSGRS